MTISLRRSTIVCVDTETTGLDPFEHGVYQVAMAIVTSDDFITAEKSWTWPVPEWAVVDPYVSTMPSFVRNQEHADKLAHFRETLSEMSQFAARADAIAGFNAEFDRTMLKGYHFRQGALQPEWLKKPWLDLLPWARHEGYPTAKSNKLQACCERRGIELPSELAHDASYDVAATGKLLCAYRGATFANSPITMADDWADLLKQTSDLALQLHYDRVMSERKKEPEPCLIHSTESK